MIAEKTPVQPASGPEVTVWQGVDCHLEPEFSSRINLGVEDFSGWSFVEFPVLSDSLGKIARMEAPERFYGQGCYDREYVSGLAHYAKELKGQASGPLDIPMLESVLRHGIYPESSPAIRGAVAELMSLQGSEVQRYISAYLSHGRSAAGVELPFKFEISTELCRALAGTLKYLPEADLPRLIELIGRSADHSETDIYDAVIDCALASSQRSVVEAAVLQLRGANLAGADELLLKCWKLGGGHSAAEGYAIASLLDKNPENQNLRAELNQRIRHGNYAFLDALSDSHVPSAVALRLDQLNREWGITHSVSQPLETLRTHYNNLFAQNQRERDLNRIAYHLGGSFSGHHESEVTAAVKTLILSNHEPSLSFLRHQLESPPNNRRAAVIAQAWREVRCAEYGQAST